MTEIAFNPLDPELASDPFPILARLRAHDPVYPSPMGPYIVTAHGPAREVLRRRDGDLRWEQFQRMRHGDSVVDEPYFTIMADSVLMKAGDDHRRVRQTFQRHFRTATVEALRPVITAEADQLIDTFVARRPGGADGGVPARCRCPRSASCCRCRRRTSGTSTAGCTGSRWPCRCSRSPPNSWPWPTSR